MDPKNTQSLSPEELIAQYGGLVWKTASVYLENPEDIKECVNETFFEFYQKNQYDPAKGQLSTFLAAIARNKAISMFRRNKPNLSEEHLQMTASKQRDVEDTEERLDLEAALSELKETDFQIIRMKYYDGMTISEIAETMELPYETVKKRHQRSLRKLRHALIVALILALAAFLIACAYRILQHYGIIPGIGISMEDQKFYVLTEPIDMENDQYRVSVEKAHLTEDVIWITLELEKNEEFVFKQDAVTWYDDVLLNASLSYNNGEQQVPLNTTFLVPSSDPDKQSVSHMYTVTDCDWEKGFTLHLRDFDVPVSLEPINAKLPEEFSYQEEELAVVLADAYLKDGHLKADLYVLSGPDYSMSVESTPTAPITAADPKGTMLTGTIDFTNYIPNSGMVTYDFGEAETGDYTISIPCLMATARFMEEYTIPMTSVGEIPSKETFYVTGGSFTFGEVTMEYPNPVGPPTGSDQPDRYYLPVRFTCTRDDFTIRGMTIPLKESLDPNVISDQSPNYGMVRQDQPDGTIVYWGSSYEIPKGLDITKYYLCIEASTTSVAYIWHQSFSLSVTVSE